MCRADARRLAFGSCGAGPAVQAGSGGAAIGRLVAVAACVARRADAGVVIDAVPAGGAIRAGVPGTLIDVDLAARACETRTTAAEPQVTVNHTMAACFKGEKKKKKALNQPYFTQIHRKGDKLLPLVHCSEVHLSTFLSQLSPV